MPPEWDGKVENEEQASQTDLGPSGPDTATSETDEPAAEAGTQSDVAASPPQAADEEVEDDESEQEEEILPKDVQYDILKNRRRRLVLRYLLEEDNPASLGTLSEYVAGIENDKDPRKLDSQERKRAYVGLYQCHLPRMNDAGVIDFNKDRGVVETGVHAEQLLPHVEQEEDDDQRLVQAYLLSSLFGLGLYLLTQSPLLGVGWLGPAVLGGTLVVVAAISVDQLLRSGDDE